MDAFRRSHHKVLEYVPRISSFKVRYDGALVDIGTMEKGVLSVRLSCIKRDMRRMSSIASYFVVFIRIFQKWFFWRFVICALHVGGNDALKRSGICFLIKTDLISACLADTNSGW